MQINLQICKVYCIFAAKIVNHADLKQMFPSADYVKNGRYVFNIGGNNYRVVAVVIFIGGVMNIRFVCTHAEYDKMDSSTIKEGGFNMEKKLTTRKEYDEVKTRVETLIAEATEKGLLESDMDNDYTRKIAELSNQMAQYEDDYMDIMPLREKTPLIKLIEDYFYARNMKQKEGAQFLGINESVFSQILSGKRRITMPLAKRLRTKLGIDAETILEYA